MKVTPVMLSTIAGALLSLFFEYFPKVDEWYDKQDEGTKRQIMLALLTAICLVIYIGACVGRLDVFGLVLACNQQGVVELGTALFLAISANQGVHRLTKKTTPQE